MRRRAAEEGLCGGYARSEADVALRRLVQDGNVFERDLGMGVGTDAVGLERTDAAVAGIVVRTEGMQCFAAEDGKEQNEQ